MEAANVHNKLILAVVQEDDYDTTVSELNQNGFFCHHAQFYRRVLEKEEHHHYAGCGGGAS